MEGESGGKRNIIDELYSSDIKGNQIVRGIGVTLSIIE